jgi:membrane-bound lytic murein transglycosylase MltF
MRTFRCKSLTGITALCLSLTPFVYPRAVQAEECEIDFPALVRAITAVESGGNPRAVGSAGERGLMQIKLQTWREVTKKEFGERIPFTRAFEPALNQQVGQAYLELIASQLALNRDKLNDDFLALLVASYHRGPHCLESVGFTTRRLSASTREYVERVLNLHGLYSSQNQMLAMETHGQPHGGVATAPN